MSTVEMAGTFRRAAEVIRYGGLARGTYEQDGTHCAVGALMAARGTVAWGAAMVKSEIGYLADLLGGLDERESDESSEFDRSDIVGFCTVTHWNDAAERTAEDVATLLEQAAEKLEADL